MKALVYNGPRNVAVQHVPDPAIERPTDVLVRITTTNICGSDLHMYEGRTDIEPGRVLGHENLGEVVDVGAAVVRIKNGDMVCLPFNIGCGFCENCEKGFTGFCLTCNPGMAGAAYGFAGMGPFNGGQAELLRVPFGDFNCLRLPPDAAERRPTTSCCADIFPTGCHATVLAGLQPGELVVIYGAGRSASWPRFGGDQGRQQGVSVDRHPDRLALAEKIGAIPIDDSEGVAVEQILELTGGQGADLGCECVGYQAHMPPPGGPEPDDEQPGRDRRGDRRDRRRRRLRAAGPERPDPLEKRGQLAFDFGDFWFKGQRVGTGQCNVKAYNRELRNLIHVRQGQAVVDRLARAAAEKAPRPTSTSTARERLDQGRAEAWHVRP